MTATSDYAATAYAAITGILPGQAAGLVQVRRNRETGTLVAVYDAVEAGIDEWGYATVCEEHGRLVIHDTLSAARSHASCPTGWCGVCNGTETDVDGTSR